MIELLAPLSIIALPLAVEVHEDCSRKKAALEKQRRDHEIRLVRIRATATKVKP